MPTLHIHLLGDFHAMLDDASVTSALPPRAQSLLAYLALHARSPQSRQRLAFLFWPDSTDDQARNSLRQSLHLLRQTLPHSERFIHADGQTVQWRPDAPFTLDVAEFERAVEQADSIDSLRAAVNRYQGELLSGCYDEWVLSERERLREKFVQVLERLVVLLEERREYTSAIHYAEYLLRSDALREETYRLLIRLHGSSGNPAEARRVYQTCVAVLKRELEVEPSGATRALYEEIQGGSAAAMPVATTVPPRRTDNLPRYLTSFVGRKEELEDLKRRFISPGKTATRLLILTGTGGCGKTRLAIQLASDSRDAFPDGVWFVDLALLTDPALIPHAIAAVLGIQEQPERAIMDTLATCLQSKTALLIFDNCEHMVDVCACMIDALLRACPSLQVLATSRERLNVMGEVVWRVPSLTLPDPADLTLSALFRADAIRLFVERACSALPTFTLNAANAAPVVQICQRLSGIPLAIELAAARIAMLTPAQIATRLDNVFALLTQGGASTLSRHQTLRAAMDWSFALLSAKEQMLFRRLAVFAGGFTLETVEAICADKEPGSLAAAEVLDLLSKLTDKSLVSVMNWEQGRYRLLEPIWQYANEKLLASGEEEPLGAQHLEFFLRLAEETEPHFRDTEQVTWFNRLMAEHDNLLAALDWSLKGSDLTAALRLTAALWYFWLARDYYTPGIKRLMQVLTLTEMAPPSAARAKALWAAGAVFLWSNSDSRRARPLLEEAVRVSREVGDRRILAGALSTMGATMSSQGEDEAARACLTESLALLRDLDDRHTTGWSLTYLGDVSLAQKDDAQAERLYAEGVDAFQAIGDINSAAYAIRRMGVIALARGDTAQAIALFEDSLALNRRLSYRKGIAACFVALAGVALHQAQFARAARLLGAAESVLDAIAAKLFPTDQGEYGRTAEALRAQLEQAASDAAWAEGGALTMDEAIDYATQADEH